MTDPRQPIQPGDPLPAAPLRPPDFVDDFTDGPDPSRWVAHYLPPWTTPDRSAGRFRSTTHGLELRIEADQPDWRPEDAPLRVSNLQTGTFSGPVGSSRSTHRHRPDGLVVRTETPLDLRWAPSSGRVDVTVSASVDTGCVLAAWLVGTEHRDERESGELCLVEIDGEAVGETTTARTGVKAHHDPRLRTDMAEVELGFDASRPHTWTVIWGNNQTVIGCEGRVIRRLAQAPDYPLLLLVGLFEVGRPAGDYPKTAMVHRVVGWQD
ncbi:MAG: family 16 glycosylhydrolase [Nocardioidaceae bacterium]